MDQARTRCVYVIGAGFSAGLGYPLTDNLLKGVWDRIDNSQHMGTLEQVIRFHNPEFDASMSCTFPNIEQFLSQLIVNEELFDPSRQYDGKLKRKDFVNLRHNVLLGISDWFHELSKKASPSKPSVSWLSAFRDLVIRENAGIISFNWDLILDELLFGQRLDKHCYGFTRDLDIGPVLLKPHGSLNWYDGNQGRFITDEKKTVLFRNGKTRVYAFREFRAPVSKRDRVYTPLMVPPVYFKNFKNPIFRRVWWNCTKLLSTAKKITFIGYSVPEADVHARFIMRCGFHNQVEGELLPEHGRCKPTGIAKVVIINPEEKAAARIRSIAGPRHECKWIPKRLEEISWTGV